MDWICLVCSPAARWSQGKSCHVKYTKNTPALQNLWYWSQCNNTLQMLLLISCIKISYFESTLVSMIKLEYMAIHLLNRLLADKDRAFCNVMPHGVVHLQPPSLRGMRCRNEHTGSRFLPNSGMSQNIIWQDHNVNIHSYINHLKFYIWVLLVCLKTQLRGWIGQDHVSL